MTILMVGDFTYLDIYLLTFQNQNLFETHKH